MRHAVVSSSGWSAFSFLCLLAMGSCPSGAVAYLLSSGRFLCGGPSLVVLLSPLVLLAPSFDTVLFAYLIHPFLSFGTCLCSQV